MRNNQNQNKNKNNANKKENPINEMRKHLYELLKSSQPMDKIHIIIDELIRWMQRNPAEFAGIFESHCTFYENVQEIAHGLQ